MERVEQDQKRLAMERSMMASISKSVSLKRQASSTSHSLSIESLNTRQESLPTMSSTPDSSALSADGGGAGTDADADAHEAAEVMREAEGLRHLRQEREQRLGHLRQGPMRLTWPPTPRGQEKRGGDNAAELRRVDSDFWL